MRFSWSILAVCLAATACASNGRLPETWGQALRNPAPACASVAGTYLNVGEEPKSRGGPGGRPMLAGILGFTTATTSAISKVRIAVSGDGAIVFTRVLAEEGDRTSELPGETRLKPTCSLDGALTWSGSARDLRASNVGDPLAGLENVSYEFRRGADGALYVTSHEYGGGLVYMFLPFGYSGTDHYRFPPAD